MRRLSLTSSFSRSEKTKQKSSFISFGAKETNQRKHSPNQGLLFTNNPAPFLILKKWYLPTTKPPPDIGMKLNLLRADRLSQRFWYDSPAFALRVRHII